jgi:hypothetical protein
MDLSLSGLKWASVMVHPPVTPWMTLMTFKVVGSSDADRRENRSEGRIARIGLESGAVMSYICKRKSSRVLELESRGWNKTYPCNTCNRRKNLNVA